MDTSAFGDAWAFDGMNGFRRALGRGLKIRRARIIAVKEYLKAMSRSGTWGGELEIAASARIIQARINVYSDNNDEEELMLCASYGCEDTERVVNILYDGFSHYDRLEKQEDEFTIIESSPNGDCLFTSVSGSISEGLELRKKIVRDMQTKKKELIGFFAFPDDVQYRKRPLTKARTQNRRRRNYRKATV